ncbi:MAG: hypothetical protein ACYS9X_05550 [Planctomycetota bacterium]
MARKKRTRKAKRKAGPTKKREDAAQDTAQRATAEPENTTDPVVPDAAAEPKPMERPLDELLEERDALPQHFGDEVEVDEKDSGDVDDGGC